MTLTVSTSVRRYNHYDNQAGFFGLLSSEGLKISESSILISHRTRKQYPHGVLFHRSMIEFWSRLDMQWPEEEAAPFFLMYSLSCYLYKMLPDPILTGKEMSTSRSQLGLKGVQ